MKQKQKFHEIYLDKDKDYTIFELQKELQRDLSIRDPKYTEQLVEWKIKVQETYEYGETYVNLFLDLYRFETDMEESIRVQREEKERSRLQRQKELRELSKIKRQEKKKKESESLITDPDYQKFLELQKKFKKK